MFKWLAKILGLQKKDPYQLTPDQAAQIVMEASRRVAEKQARDEARIREMMRPNQGFTKPTQPADPAPRVATKCGSATGKPLDTAALKEHLEVRRSQQQRVEPPQYTRRGVRIPTPEESRRARPATPPPAPPSPPASDSGSNLMMAAVVLSTMDSTPSYSPPSHDTTPSGGYDSGSCDGGGGGGSCD
ncbi:hypothetical protein pEaSNUABM56_00088 [Erwinia phage pEa_SNUABM_56]|uniref:Uncharacterized protein n=1 Tax=Erwinia phage pEp_SNUABM_01 TaxID=2601643 RepID=A0A5J6DAR2_9CAUD|nr:hypothetical protein HWC63_gp061 [Erwinia phage pEp_SNUABM_01]QEQ94887.1 hypothetical protein pEpSNUABM01_061 [Erwinia phage pEp_SNUABM_01]UYL84818.1 hypothetical protein pEaSNUABM55_00020 [Erwinia phage pEa_SNUABM_55]UYL85133.1 hypothetical protein pEaSNUABM56_00088 [Erwinia phage pEa_SNUABM_56]